jgi:hypothetical protein
MGDDDAERREMPVSHWMRRETPEEDRERNDLNVSAFLVQFYAVIPLMVVAFFLPAGAVRGTWVVIVLGGFCVWLVLRATRGRRRRAAASASPDGRVSETGTSPPDPGA